MTALEAAGQAPQELLLRHVAGDWGDLVAEDIEQNEEALKVGNWLFSAYELNDGTRVWVITEWNRSVTTLRLPME